MPPPHAAFGRRLRTAIARKGWTQAELCRQASVSANTVSSWARGQSLPRSNRLGPVARLLDVPVDELLGGQRLPAVANQQPTPAPVPDGAAMRVLEQVVAAARDPVAPDLMTALKAAEQLVRSRQGR